MTFTAWQLIGWESGDFRISGGRRIYENVQYNCVADGRCVKLMRLKTPNVVSATVIRYVEPETLIDLIEPISEEGKKFLAFQGLLP